jgi:cell division protein FtsB
MTRRRVVTWLLVAAAVLAAVQWGQFSTVDLLRQRSREAMLRRAVDSLQHDVDSLQALRRRILSDPATQERIAREDFGMVRGNRELLYRFVDADSLRRASRR